MKIKLLLIGTKANKNEVDVALPAVIGRSREASLTIGHPMISRKHCELSERDGAVVVRDLGSLNGTLVKGEAVGEAVLQAGEEFTVGPVTFRLQLDDAGQARKVAPDDDVPVAQPIDDIPVAAPIDDVPVAMPVVSDIPMATPVAGHAPARDDIPVATPVEPMIPVAMPIDEIPPALPVGEPNSAKPSEDSDSVPLAMPVENVAPTDNDGVPVAKPVDVFASDDTPPPRSASSDDNVILLDDSSARMHSEPPKNPSNLSNEELDDFLKGFQP